MSERRLSFGGVAALYDRARPSYPDALIDDLLALAPADRALEVGAGTGKATALFAARGVGVQALEPSVEMAQLARRRCAGHPEVTVIETEFERWQPDGSSFPLLFCAQAWHWLDPARRCALARAVLEPGGLLAAFWNRVQWSRCALREPLGRAYHEYTPELIADGPMHPGSRADGPDLWDRWNAEVRASVGLGSPELRDYEWTTSYPTAGYLELVQTHSDHIVLPAERRARLLRAVAEVIDAAGGSLELTYVTKLCLARAC